jgi:hypothetical protein
VSEPEVSCHAPDTPNRKLVPLIFERLPPVNPTSEPGVDVAKAKFKESPAESLTVNCVKKPLNTLSTGFKVKGPTFGENPVAVISTETRMPRVLSMTILPPSVHIGVQEVPDIRTALSVPVTVSVMTPAFADTPLVRKPNTAANRIGFMRLPLIHNFRAISA